MKEATVYRFQECPDKLFIEVLEVAKMIEEVRKPSETPTKNENKTTGGILTDKQLAFIKKLQEEQLIPEDYDASNITVEEAKVFIKQAIEKRDRRDSGDY